MSWLYYLYNLLVNLPKIADVIKEILDIISKMIHPEAVAASMQLKSVVGELRDTKLAKPARQKLVALRDELKSKV